MTNTVYYFYFTISMVYKLMLEATMVNGYTTLGKPKKPATGDAN